jgi:hypothetical protein
MKIKVLSSASNRDPSYLTDYCQRLVAVKRTLRYGAFVWPYDSILFIPLLADLSMHFL